MELRDRLAPIAYRNLGKANQADPSHPALPDAILSGDNSDNVYRAGADSIADEQTEIECVDTKKAPPPNFFEMVLFTWYQNDTLTAKPPLKK